MTFILGMKCTDGLVLCADSLESDGVTKRYRNKLEHFTVGEEWSLRWGGSGNAEVVDKFSGQLKKILVKEHYDRDKIEIRTERCLQYIGKNYPREPIAIVAGMFGRPFHRDKKNKTESLGAPEFHLYRGRSDAGCLSPEKSYCVAGMDVTLSSFVLDTIYHLYIRVAEAERVGVFTTALMKDYAEGVGGHTTLFSYLAGDPEWDPLLERELKVMEETFPVLGARELLLKHWSENPLNFSTAEINEAELRVKRNSAPRQITTKP